MKTKKSKTYHLKYKINQIPLELQNYFIFRWILAAISLVIVVCVFLLAGLHTSLPVVALGIIFYAGYMVYCFYRVLSGKLILVQGICESKSNDHYKVSNPLFKKTNFLNLFEYYGKSTITVVSDDIKFIVPVRHNYPAQEGQTINIYFFPDEFYQETENSFRVNNPLFVKVIKL